MPTLASRDACTGEVLGEVPETAPDDLGAVVDAVAAVQPFWSALPLSDRSRYLRRIAQVVLDEVDSLSELLAREQGRPRTEAVTMEILASVDALRWIAAYAPRFLADQRLRTHQLPLRGKRSTLVRDPVGVVGVAAPWSSPWASGMRRVANALMAGNGVVLVPDPLVPLAAVRLVGALQRAGLPEGLVRVVAGRDDLAGALERHGAGRVVRIGTDGHDPLLVLADAPMPHAVAGALWAAFANAGQSRVNVARVYVRRELAGMFTDALVAAAGRLRLGDPRRWDVDLGPLTTAEHLPQVRAAVERAVADGATVLTGGPTEVPGVPGPFVAPVVLGEVRPGMAVLSEPIPGPVLPVVAVDSDDEAIALANAVPSVGASVWTADRGRGERITRELRAERAWINEHMPTALSPAGVAEFVDVRLRVWEPGRLRDLWWYPYDESLARTMKAATRYFYGRESERLRAVREGALPAVRLARRLARDSVRR
jgi:acyl-CoA reductase-like NAD-dependent aldehyde dehydrogenase